MIPFEFDYVAPASLGEALGLLEDPGAKPLAGGMSLIPLMKLRLAGPEKLVDLSGIGELNGVSESGGEIHIGAMTTHFTVESSALIRGKCPLLAETASMIGDVQVRNMGTIGGSIAHSDPAADYPAALQALEAKVRLASKSGERTLPIGDFLVDTFATAAEPGELVREIVVPIDGADTGTSYKKMLQPASGFAIVGVAVRVRKQGGKITFARVGVTGLGARSFRAFAVEDALLVGASVDEAAAHVADTFDANADLHASADYRKHMAQVYAARALRTALDRIT